MRNKFNETIISQLSKTIFYFLRQLTVRLLVVTALMFGFVTFANAQDAELSARQKGIIPIAAFTANGDLNRLKIALNEGLDAGLTVNEIKEVLVQMYAYAGFPRSLHGIDTFMTVMDVRKSEGKKDNIGQDASPMPTGESSLQFGTKNQTKLVGQPVTAAKFKFVEFSPVMDQFLKAHLFGDIFQRDILTWSDRELATIAALSSMKGCENELRFHLKATMNTGLNETQMQNFISVLYTKVGTNEATAAQKLFAEVTKNIQ